MQREYGFDNGNGTSASKGLRFLAYPSIEYGREEIENISVAGKKGTLTKKTGIYTDTIISNKMEYVSESRELSETERIVLTEWLKGTKTVSYSDMPDYFFKVKKVEIDDALRKYGIYGNLTAEFTCEPGIYLKSGEKAQTVVSGAKFTFGLLTTIQNIGRGSVNSHSKRKKSNCKCRSESYYRHRIDDGIQRRWYYPEYGTNRRLRRTFLAAW